MPGFSFSSIDRGCPIPAGQRWGKGWLTLVWSGLTSTRSHDGNISIVGSCGGELPGHGRDWLLEPGEHLERSWYASGWDWSCWLLTALTAILQNFKYGGVQDGRSSADLSVSTKCWDKIKAGFNTPNTTVSHCNICFSCNIIENHLPSPYSWCDHRSSSRGMTSHVNLLVSDKSAESARLTREYHKTTLIWVFGFTQKD